VSQPFKRHLDRFSGFAQLIPVTDTDSSQTDKYTETQTTLRVKSVAIGHIYTMRAGDGA